ncbi:MAG: Fic family protein, partial [Burkholderiales bacterium]
FIDVPERDYIEGTLAIYELTRVELLRDLFAWAYERSAQRCSALRRSVVEPDPFRLAHRAQLIELVGDVVRRRLPADEPTVRRLAQTLVAGADLDQFVAMALNDLRHLYEGNVARYRLRLADYHGWKTAVGGHA